MTGRRHERCDRRSLCCCSGHRRQVGPVPTARLAARRDGGPDSGFGADPRRDDGGGRRIPGGAHLSDLYRKPDRAAGRGDHRRVHGAVRRDSSPSRSSISSASWPTRRSRSSASWSRRWASAAGSPALFHLLTHAFFKALLFLGSGSVIHGMEATVGHDPDRAQDIRNMGGLRRFMPVTFWTYFIGYLALSGMPFFAGFWSQGRDPGRCVRCRHAARLDCVCAADRGRLLDGVLYDAPDGRGVRRAVPRVPAAPGGSRARLGAGAGRSA